MYHHMILMVSDYNSDKRIALHKSYSDFSSSKEFRSIVKTIKEEFKEIKFSTHHIVTEKKSVISVSEYDSYFKDVIFMTDPMQFRLRLRESMKITPEDIAKYILTKGEFDKLQLQKLVFFTYSKYSINHETPLFKEKFRTWKYGPVIPSLYHRFNAYKDDNRCHKLSYRNDDRQKIMVKTKFSRIKDSEDVIKIIDSVIEKYGKTDGVVLKELTHKKGTPWYKTVNEVGFNKEIPFEVIKQYEIKNV